MNDDISTSKSFMTFVNAVTLTINMVLLVRSFLYQWNYEEKRVGGANHSFKSSTGTRRDWDRGLESIHCPFRTAQRPLLQSLCILGLASIQWFIAKINLSCGHEKCEYSLLKQMVVSIGRVQR